MRHILFTEAETYSIAVLIKSTSFNKRELELNYINPLVSRGIAEDSLIAFDLQYNEDGKAPVKFIKEYLDELLPVLESLAVKYLYVPDSNYFKVLTGQTKAEPHFGYVLPCKIKGYEHMNVVLGINYQALIYNPDLQAKLNMSLDTLSAQVAGTYQALGTGIIHSAWYPEGTQEIREALESLHQYPSLSADIEGFSLRFNEAGIGTIAFAWDEHNGIAFACDYHQSTFDERDRFYLPNPEVRALLREFFLTYKGEITWHHCTYDTKAIIYALWMQDPLDTEGLLTGLDAMTRNMHDTKIQAYLATNSTAGNVLGLKTLAHEYAGNWAVEDIKDIRKIPLKELLQYNMVDALSTAFVSKKYWPVLVQDNQEKLYRELMLPSLKTIIQMELTGMPMDTSRIQEVKEQLQAQENSYLEVLTNSPLIKVLNLIVQEDAMEAANAKLKTKQHPIEKFAGITFNPNSGPQVQKLLYEQMGLPVLDYTDTKQPATGGDTLKKLLNHVQHTSHRQVLEALIGLSEVSKILTAFIPNFEKGIDKADGKKYLHGSFNLGGTVSGRMSSSQPNLQQIPSGSKYGKLIKSCFSAPKGWLFVGADFNALEDRINALLTKDPNKLKVFTDGYDSHCLRSFYFFPDRLPGITEDVKSINSIKDVFPKVRQDAKSPAFAIQYAGTWRTLVKNLGFEEGLAKQIESNFHKMYAVSGHWVKAEIAKAAAQGYAETAFGLRIRTPLLAQTFLGHSNTPREAEAEARTLGNAISGQAFGLLNNRAGNAFMEKVWKSKYRYDIKPVAMVHDAFYLLVRDNVEVVAWVNRELPLEMSWQELPEIQHPQVTLGAELDIHFEGWHQPITLPNHTTPEEISALAQKGKQAWLDKQSKGKKHEETPQPGHTQQSIGMVPVLRGTVQPEPITSS